MMDSEPAELDSGLDSPQTTAKSPQTTLRHFLDLHPHVSFLRCQWQDYSGILRARVVPIEHGLALAAKKRTLHVPPCAFHLTVKNEFYAAAEPKGSHWLLPDWDSLYTRQQLDPDHATVMCTVAEHLPLRPEPSWHLCPRRALETVVATARERLRVDFLVGFEVEFQVLKPSAGEGQPLEPSSVGPGRCAVAGLRDPCWALVEEAVRILLRAGVGIGAFQSEGDRGQFELALEPASPLRAVDQLVLVHETLKSVFARQGLVATMAPRPVAASQQMAGQHTHVSINPPDRVPLTEDAFLAGVLARLPALCALCLPYDLSYERVRPYLGGHMVAWGSENRAVPVRRINPGHWELRFVDATANMYVALAAILGAGLLGCLKEQPLVWPDSGLAAEHYPADATPLPQSIQESLDQLDACCDELQDLMGSQVIRHYLAVKRAEALQLSNLSQAAARQLLNEMF